MARWVHGVIPSTGDPKLDAAVDRLVAASSGPAGMRDAVRRQVSQVLHGTPVWERPARSAS